MLAAAVIASAGPVDAGSLAPPVRSLAEIRERNVVLQHWDLSCGAAALATILRFQHGEPVTERSVALGLIDRAEYIDNPDLVRLRQGFSLLDMKRFVDSLGYVGVGLGNMGFDDLLDHAPLIVPVDLGGYPHFVVFRGAERRRVLLADPAFGNYTIDRDSFVEGWIDHDEIGRVGFIVNAAGMSPSSNALTARRSEFLMLN